MFWMCVEHGTNVSREPSGRARANPGRHQGARGRELRHWPTELLVQATSNGAPVIRTIGDVMVATLKASGVRRVYGIAGDSLNGFTDALRRDDEMTWKHVRHEEAAALAASGDAAVTGELAVCVGSSGPGNLHLINGLYDANRSRVPVLAIAAHLPRSQIGAGYFQETHPQELFRECSVYSELVSVPEQLIWVLESAMRAAIAKRGVAVVTVPGEIFGARVPAGTRPRTVKRIRSTLVPAPEAVAAAADVLNGAQRVTILAGAGCAGAHDEVIELAGLLQAPVVHALRGKEFIEYDNPYDVGGSGLLGISSGAHAMRACDALLMLGTDFPYRDFYPEDARVVQVDVRGENIGRRVEVDVAVVGDVKEAVAALVPLLRPGRDGEHLQRMLAHFERTRRQLDDVAQSNGHDAPVHPQVLTRAVSDVAADDAIFLPDVGTPTLWATRYLRMNGRRRLLGSFIHGTMANALPQAIGVQAAQPGRQVVALSGDGGLTMMLGELLTLRQLDLPVKIVVYNNRSLAFVELEMKADGIVNYGTELDQPDLSAVARAMGLEAIRVERTAELGDGLRCAFAHDGPALVEVMTVRHELAFPPAIDVRQATGFALWATRSVLSGRGDEVLEVTRENLRQAAAEVQAQAQRNR